MSKLREIAESGQLIITPEGNKVRLMLYVQLE